MSYRPQLDPVIVINSGDMTLTLTSSPTIIQKLSMLSYQVDWSGASPVGALSVELSNNYSLNPDGSVRNAGTWNTATLQYSGSPVTSIPISGNTGSGLVDIDLTAAYAIRLVYTPTSGTGSITAVACGKVS